MNSKRKGPTVCRVYIKIFFRSSYQNKMVLEFRFFFPPPVETYSCIWPDFKDQKNYSTTLASAKMSNRFPLPPEKRIKPYKNMK